MNLRIGIAAQTIRQAAYSDLGDDYRAVEDYMAAARLGDKRTQDILREEGISW